MRFFTLLLLVGTIWAQTATGPLVGISYGNGGLSTPQIINFSGFPSAETTAVGASANVPCATDSFCGSLADPSLAGNAIVIFYRYKAASGDTANIPTISTTLANGTPTGDTYTHCGTDANNSTNDFYLGCYYHLTPTTGTEYYDITWTAAVTEATGGAAQVGGITAKDVYATNSWTSTSATFSSGSATSTANGDLWFELGCATNTITNIAAWTLGSQAGITWLPDVMDRRDACMIQHGIQTTAGALNPQFTNATAYDGAALGIAFKAGVAGKAPTGIYVYNLYHVSSATGSSNLVYQIPAASGDLLAVTTSGGATQTITAVSDTVNGSWTACGPPVVDSPTNTPTTSAAYYFANSGAGPATVTLTVSGNSDTGPAMFYDIKGANSTQICAWASPLQQNGNPPTGATFTAFTGFVPSSNSGIVIAATSQELNTALGLTAGNQDCSTIGGQSLSGPSLPDQNNGCSHYYTSNNSPTNIVWNEASAITSVAANSSKIISFQSVSPIYYPVMVKSCVNQATASGANGTVACTSFVPAFAGDTLLVWVSANGISTGTETCSDPTNGSYTALDGPTNASSWRMATAYAKNISASTVTITCTVATSNTARSIHVQEWHGVSTSSPIDQHSGVTSVAISAGVATGAPVTTLSANEGIGFALSCQGSCDSTTTSSAGPIQPWTQPAADDTFSDTMGFLAAGATNTFTPSVADSGGSGSEAVATISVH